MEAEAIWDDDLTRQFAEVLTNIKNLGDMKNFLRDVMTEREITEISGRLEAAKMLSAGSRYVDVMDRTKLSSRTVARVSDWRSNGCGGYDFAVKLLNDKKQ